MSKPNFCTGCQHCLAVLPNAPIMNECAVSISNYASPDLHELCIGLNKDGMCKKFQAKGWDSALKHLKEGNS